MTAGSGGPAPNRVCDVARIDIPIIQAPMTYIAGAQLAAAVSNAGALGIIETTSDQGRADLRRVRDLTDAAVGANIALIMNRDPAVVDLLVANDIGFVTTSAGDPSLFTGRLHNAGITVFHVVGTLASAEKAVDAGVDGLVVEGVEGGEGSARRGKRRVVIRRLRDLRHEFGVRDVAVGADHDHRPGKQPGHGTVDDRRAVVLAEAVAERRSRSDVLDALRAAESPLREWQIFRHAHHGHTAHGRALVEGPHARRTYRRIHGRKDVQHHGLTAELLAADRSEVATGQGEGRGFGSDGGQLADSVDRVSTQGYLCHGHSLPSPA